MALTEIKAKKEGLVMSEMSLMGHEQVIFCNDTETGLKAIIAIHDTTLGTGVLKN
jgi:leucine dehydrogenase